MSEEKKIFIDEDWKSQVEAEKAAAAAKADSDPPASAEGMAGEPLESAADTAPTDTTPTDAGGSLDGENPSGVENADDPPMPPASFGMLMSSLASESLFAMGQFPHPATGETVVRRNQAKYLIDTLAMLKEKTEGNLTPDETSALDDVIHQLRMAFVATK